MAIAFDAITSNTASGSGDDVSFTHTPVGTPRGVLVFVTFTGSFSGLTDQVTSTPTYGGVSMAEVPLSMLVFSGTEDKQVHAFYLGSSIPTGPQTVAFTVDTILAFTECITYTAAADTEVVDTTAINTTASGDVTGTLSLGGRTCAAAMGFVNGSGLPADTTPLTDWTQQRETDHGSQTSGVHTYDIVGSTDVTFGTNEAASTHIIVLGVAVSEVVSAGAYTLDADSATYTYSATDADVLHGHLIDAAAASYAWTANDATLTRDIPLSAEAAAYAWTASDADLEYVPLGTTYTLDADAAAYLWSATDADLVYVQLTHYSLDADAAAYVWTANDIGLEYSGAQQARPLTYGIGSLSPARVRAKYEEIEEIDRRIRAKEEAERERVRKQQEAKRQLAELAEKKRQTKTIAERRRKLEARIEAYQSEITDLRTAMVAMLDEMERARVEIEQQQVLQMQQTIADRRLRMLLLIAAAS
jgi:hypothetical protein